MDTSQILLAIAGVLVLGAVAWFWWQQEKKTADKKAREAKANGWTYERDGGNLHRKYRHLPFFDGESEKVKHVMQGDFRGRPLTLFTFQFREDEKVRSGLFEDGDRDNDGRRDTKTVKRLYGVVVVGVAQPLPQFELSAADRATKRAVEERARMGGFVGNMVGDVLGDTASDLLVGKDHTGAKVTTGDQAFDEVFTVRSTNPDATRALLTPQARAWLLQSEHARKYVLWADGQEVITWGTGTDTAIGKVKATYLNDVLDQLPAGQTWGPPPA